MLEKNKEKSNFFYFNPIISLLYKSEKNGLFTVEFQQNNKNPENKTLLSNPFLSSYNTFTKGIFLFRPIENFSYSLQHSLLEDEKRFAVNSSITYLVSNHNLGFENWINQNFILSTYNQTIGNKNLIGYFQFINYIKKLRLSIKLETNQKFNYSPTKVNSDSFLILKNYTTVN